MEQRRSFRWGVLLIVSLAAFVLVIDTTTMEVSMSAVANDLNTDLFTIQSVITIYTLMKAAFMLIGRSCRIHLKEEDISHRCCDIWCRDVHGRRQPERNHAPCWLVDV
ncbi:MAG TPA: hypothetical protein ENN44_05450 [Methanoculleus sp.]|nr:hypothetical protein [Methanoculleus sp.]